MVYVGVASWAQIALVGLIGALTYVLSRLVQERRFYRNKVSNSCKFSTPEVS